MPFSCIPGKYLAAENCSQCGLSWLLKEIKHCQGREGKLPPGFLQLWEPWHHPGQGGLGVRAQGRWVWVFQAVGQVSVSVPGCGSVSVPGCGTGAGDSGAADTTALLSAWLNSSLLPPGATWQIQNKSWLAQSSFPGRCCGKQMFFSLAFLHNGVCSATGKMSYPAYEDQWISELFQLTKRSRTSLVWVSQMTWAVPPSCFPSCSSGGSQCCYETRVSVAVRGFGGNPSNGHHTWNYPFKCCQAQAVSCPGSWWMPCYQCH